jgi:hypothetical protein
VLGFCLAGLMLRLRNSSRAQDWSARSRLLARTFVVEPRRLLEIDRNGPVSASRALCFGKPGRWYPRRTRALRQLGRALFWVLAADFIFIFTVLGCRVSSWSVP